MSVDIIDVPYFAMRIMPLVVSLDRNERVFVSYVVYPSGVFPKIDNSKFKASNEAMMHQPATEYLLRYG